MSGEGQKLRVRTFVGRDLILQVGVALGEQTQVLRDARVECLHGERRLTLTAVLEPSLPPNTVVMSNRAAEQLGLHEYTWQMPANVQAHRIHFGPLIGILANPKWNSKARTLQHTKQLDSLVKLVECGQAHGAVCFLFGISSVDLKAGSIRGYVLHDGLWHRRAMPMPNVIYDQLVSRKVEQDPSVQDKRDALVRRYGDKFFNGGFFDKWQVYEWLLDDSNLKAHLPRTLRHTTLNQAANFINSHSVSFLKPLHGSLGLGIAHFVRQKNGGFIYEVKQRTASVTRGKANSAKEVLQPFRTRLKNRPYIWQEGLMLATYRERPVDVRILMQRDHTGSWKRTKMFARVAKTGDFTSNLTGGGDAMTVDEALAECLPKVERRNRAKGQIRRLSREIVEAMEASSGRRFGEMGIDLGLDTSGKVWVIEVNSKPRKTPTTEKGRQDLVDLSFERPIRYAIYLATDSNT